jgi:hypothetical protein
MDLVSDLRARRRRGVGISANYGEDVEGIPEFRISSECIGKVFLNSKVKQTGKLLWKAPSRNHFEVLLSRCVMGEKDRRKRRLTKYARSVSITYRSYALSSIICSLSRLSRAYTSGAQPPPQDASV